MAKADEFRFNSGRLALDLPATLRRRSSEPEDVLAPSGAAARWLSDAGLLTHGHPVTGAQVRQLLELREAIWMLADRARADGELPVAAVDAVNTAAAYDLAVPRLDAASGTIQQAVKDQFSAAMAILARDAIDLVGTPSRYRVKRCAQPDCQMLFIDASPSSRRRWCSMDRCGSRAKGTKFRSRNKDHGHGR